MRQIWKKIICRFNNFLRGVKYSPRKFLLLKRVLYISGMKCGGTRRGKTNFKTNHMNELSYVDFLKTKQKKVIESGFDIDESELNPMLFDFQKFTVKRALRAGKYAIFANTGQGKTPMQLEISHQVYLHTQKPVLILAPLAVTGQTIEQGKKFNIEVSWFTENKSINIANYDQLENIDCE